MALRRASMKYRDASNSPDREPAYLAVGKLRRPHGLHGEMIMDVLTDFPERLKRGVWLYAGSQYLPLQLASVRQHAKTLLVAFEACTSPEDAGQLRSQFVYVRADDRPPLPEGEYYHHQLLGLRVVDEDDHFLGLLQEILETGANDVYVVKPDTGPDILLPAIEPVIVEINLTKNLIRVKLLPGLIRDAE
jgi:16S rRNA processing protein RimM